LKRRWGTDLKLLHWGGVDRWPRRALVSNGPFLLHAQRAADRYAVPIQDILLESGRRCLVGGQEDVMIEIAVQLAAAG
jgi:DmpG-like communication domain